MIFLSSGKFLYLNPNQMTEQDRLKGVKVLLGISGGIAAYKSLILIRLFKKAGAEVRVVVTKNSLEFVSRVSLESLSQNKLYSSVFGSENDYSTEHVSLTDWADVFVVAPATGNIIGKFASGIADDALSTSFMAFNGKVFIAPSMNVKMYEHHAVQKNLSYLASQGVKIIEPGEGYLACGYEGKGRMAEAEEIFETIKRDIFSNVLLKGKKVLVTAGPTYEAIDPVRFIGNHSSGKMGFAIAETLSGMGAEVYLVHGPVSVTTKDKAIKTIGVQGAKEMHKKCLDLFERMDACVMSAAVADYMPAHTEAQKIKKKVGTLSLELIPTPDILSELGRMKRPDQVLVGFALETQDEEQYAREKLKKKNLDFIVMNSLNDAGAGFGTDTNKVSIIDNKSDIVRYPLKTKTEVAQDISNKLCEYLLAKKV